MLLGLESGDDLPGLNDSGGFGAYNTVNLNKNICRASFIPPFLSMASRFRHQAALQRKLGGLCFIIDPINI